MARHVRSLSVPEFERRRSFEIQIFFDLSWFSFELFEGNSGVLQAFLIPLLVLEHVLNHDNLPLSCLFLESTEVNVKRKCACVLPCFCN